MLYFQAASNMVVDIGLLVLPMSIVMKSMMNMRIKISIIVIFLLACSYVNFSFQLNPLGLELIQATYSGTICSGFRIYYLKSLLRSKFRKQPPSFESSTLSYNIN